MFTEVISQTYCRCWTFDPGNHAGTPNDYNVTVEGNGRRAHKLHLDMALPKDVVPLMFQSAAVRATVHNTGTKAQVEKFGLSLGPGEHHDISLRQRTIHRLADGYTDPECPLRGSYPPPGSGFVDPCPLILPRTGPSPEPSREPST